MGGIPGALMLTLLGMLQAGAGWAESPRPVWTGPGVNLLGGPSLDGRLLSYVDAATGDLAVRLLASGESRRLTHNDPAAGRGEFAYFSAIAPDGKHVAYAWFNDQKFYDLRVVTTDGSKPRILFRNEESGFVQPCAWSPDGKRILTLFFRKDNISQIALVAAADGAVRVLKSLNWVYPKKMDFSPDGRFIVYDNFQDDKGQARDIFVLSTDGSREVRLIEHPANDLFPVWSPDGNQILFASDRGGTTDAWSIGVEDGAPQGEPRLLQRDLGRFLPMGITRHGDYYYGVHAGATDVFIAALDSAAGGISAEPLVATPRGRGANSGAMWAPDGEHLAYFSRRGSENYGQASRVITVRSMKTGAERDLFPKLAHMERLEWSPDGRALLVSGSDRRSLGGLYLVDAKTGDVTSVVQDDNAGFRGLEGTWSPGGDAVLYALNGAIRLRAIANGEERRIYAAPAAPAHLHNLALSPDGASLAFSTSRGAILIASIGKPGSTRELAAPKGDVTGIAWTKHGLLVTKETDGKSAAWRLSLDGGPPQAIGLPDSLLGPISPHPDGRHIAFTAGKDKAEVWVMRKALGAFTAAR